VTALLALDRVSARAGDRSILDEVSLEVGPGELVALMGSNGAGKSTLLDIAAGLRRPTGGAVRLDGRPLDALAPAERARAICHLPQAVSADVPFAVWELVMMGRYPHAESWFESKADRAAVEIALQRAGAAVFRDRRVSTLSGGERQRVLLASCLAQEARVLLLDEPATFLDVDQQLHCFTLLREEVARGTAGVAVTHDLNLALTFATRLVVLGGGTVAFDATPAQALASSEWLDLFSSRLRLQSDVAGRRWVSFV
jgi:iron complex transport system ATP-binding protein